MDESFRATPAPVFASLVSVFKINKITVLSDDDNDHDHNDGGGGDTESSAAIPIVCTFFPYFGT